MIFLDSLGKISYNLNNLNMNYVSGTVLKDLGKVPCIYFGDRTHAALNFAAAIPPEKTGGIFIAPPLLFSRKTAFSAAIFISTKRGINCIRAIIGSPEIPSKHHFLKTDPISPICSSARVVLEVYSFSFVLLSSISRSPLK